MQHSEQRIEGYEPGDGSAIADDALNKVSAMFEGRIPNFHKVLAISPPVITAFEGMRRSLQKTKLKPIEREIVALEVSRRSNCQYCLAAHSKFMRMYKVSEEDIAAVVEGTPMSEPRHALVQEATAAIYDSMGHLSDKALNGFYERGLSRAELIEIIAVIGWYVLSTFSNNLAQTRIDTFWTD
ncbi:carboxymuconolactone decarboxylase family protein [bacterium]|nr:carboxymuconolactone decarboxylase family protein [bacterium]